MDQTLDMASGRTRARTVLPAWCKPGIKVTAPNLEIVIAGSPFFVIRNNRDEVEARIKKEMTEIHVNLAEEGIVIKADTIGALEALCKELGRPLLMTAAFARTLDDPSIVSLGKHVLRGVATPHEIFAKQD